MLPGPTLRRSRTAARLVTLVALALCLVGLPARPGEAAAGPHAALVVPRTGTEVSGVVDVVFHALDVGGPVLTGATVTLGAASHHQAVDPQSCPIACELQATLDVGAVADGPQTLRIGLDVAGGGTRTSEFTVLVRNAPTVHLPAEIEAGWVAAQDTGDVRVAVEAHAGATTSSVVWTDPRGAVALSTFDDPADPDDPPGRSWRASVPTKDLPDGPWTGTVTATDSRGLSASRSVTLVVVHTLTLTPAPAWTTAVDDLALHRFDLAYGYAPAVRDAYPLSATIAVDGRTVAVDRRLELRDVAPDENAGVATVETDLRLAPGRHQVAITVVDNRGVTRVLTRTVQVTPTLTAAWLTGAGEGLTFIDGDLNHLRASVVTASDVELLGCRYTQSDRHGDFPALCSQRADGTWLVDAEVVLQRFSSPVTVTLRMIPSRGPVATLSTVVRVLPRLSARVTSASAVAGKSFTLVGEVTGAATIPSGATVELQRRTGTRWTTVGTARTRAGSAEVSFRTKTARSVDYRLVPRAKKGSWGSAPGAARHVTVTSTLKVTKKPRTVAKRRSFTVKATTLPSDRGVLLQLMQFRPELGEWVSIANAKTRKGGKATFTVTIAATSKLRVYREPSDAAYTSTSKTFTVKVR